MKKVIGLLNVLSLALVFFGGNLLEAAEVKYERNKFNDYILNNIEEMPENIRGSKIKEFISSLGEQEVSNHAIWAFLTIKNFGLSECLSQSGFKLHFANENKMEWVFKEGAPLPAAMTSTAVAKVLLIDDEKNVLLIENTDLKGVVRYLGGAADPHELITDTAVREVKEESGFTILPEDLHLIGQTARINNNRYGATDYVFYFVCFKFSGDLVLQADEISFAEWVPVAEVMERGSKGYLRSYEFNAINFQILKRISDGYKGVKPQFTLDYRQMFKPEAQRDLEDKMILNLF